MPKWVITNGPNRILFSTLKYKMYCIIGMNLIKKISWKKVNVPDRTYERTPLFEKKWVNSIATYAKE